MESWKIVWRNGIAQFITTAGLRALEKAIVENDPRLIQGSTTTPPPLMTVKDWPVEAACALGYCGWQGDDLTTVGEVEEYFARICYEADQQLGEQGGCRWFLNYFDDTPRSIVFEELASEVELELQKRGVLENAA